MSSATNAIAAAEQALARGAIDEATAALGRARLALRGGPPAFAVTSTVVTSGASAGLGMYEPARRVVGKAGETLAGSIWVVPADTLWLYAEVDGALERPSAVSPGRYIREVEVVGRFYAEGDDGHLELLGDKKLGTHRHESYRRGDPLYVGLEMTLGAVPAGRYAVEVVVRDLHPERARQAPTVGPRQRFQRAN